MRVGVIQSAYLPWRGYFDFIQSVDLFVVYDDVQFSKGAWRNRNRLKTPTGLQWITVPVRHRALAQRICETEIDYARDWRSEHRAALRINYARAPFLADARALLEPALAASPLTISELNVTLLRAVCGYLGIRTPIRMSSEFPTCGGRTERLITLLQAAGATSYVSGPTARAYLDEAQFARAGIALEYKSYAYPDYPQQWGAFEGAVSVLDLIANCGPSARTLITSDAANERAAA